MASDKFVIKCGNFAVLVDVHILPEGSNKDTSWFSDQEKEEVCMYLEEVVVSRIKHYLEARKQRGQLKSIDHASSSPLFITANNFHITAYFMKRRVNLRCALGKRYRELRMFPDKFVVCISKLEFNPSAWMCENGALVFASSPWISPLLYNSVCQMVCVPAPHLVIIQSYGFIQTKVH